MGSSPSVTQHCVNATKIAFHTVIVRFCDGCIGHKERCFPPLVLDSPAC